MAQESNKLLAGGTVFAYVCLGKIDGKRVYRTGRTKKIFVPGQFNTEKQFLQSFKQGSGLNRPSEVIVVCPVLNLEKGWDIFRDISGTTDRAGTHPVGRDRARHR